MIQAFAAIHTPIKELHSACQKSEADFLATYGAQSTFAGLDLNQSKSDGRIVWSAGRDIRRNSRGSNFRVFWHPYPMCVRALQFKAR